MVLRFRPPGSRCRGAVPHLAACLLSALASCAGPAASSPPRPDAQCGVLFLGTSLTAGYGLDSAAAFPAVIERDLRAAGWQVPVLSLGVPGETSAELEARLGGLLRTWDPGVLVIETGANDMLLGLPAAQVAQTLARVADSVTRLAPRARPVLLAVPPGPGGAMLPRGQNGAAIARAVSGLAQTHAWPLVPDLLAGVRFHADLNQPDHLHPNGRGAQVLAHTVGPVLEQALRRQGCRPTAVRGAGTDR